MLTLADFRRGRKFRVIKPGCELNGELPSGGFGTGLRHTWESCVIPLSVGDVLTCNGPGLDRLRNGKVVQWRNENGEWMTYYSTSGPAPGAVMNHTSYTPTRPTLSQSRSRQRGRDGGGSGADQL